MADITNQSLGTGDTLAMGHSRVEVLEKEIDIAKAVADGLTTGDYIKIAQLEAGTIFLALDAVITETLVLGANNSIDIGTTIADPDEYIDNQTTTAVGRFGAYVSACVTPAVLTADSELVCEVHGDSLASGTGKIAVTIVVVRPSKNVLPLAAAHTYAN